MVLISTAQQQPRCSEYAQQLKISWSAGSQSQAPRLSMWLISNFCYAPSNIGLNRYKVCVAQKIAGPSLGAPVNRRETKTTYKYTPHQIVVIAIIPRRQKAFPRREPRVKKAIKRGALSGCPTSQPATPIHFLQKSSVLFHNTHTSRARFYFLINNLCVCITCASACDSTFLPTSSAALRENILCRGRAEPPPV